jgi:tRNA(adenine34) deaminase
MLESAEYANYMAEALILAGEALEAGEVPVGAVVVSPGGQIIGRGRNRTEESKSPLRHAEALAIEEACLSMDDWRLGGCALFVTLEPCPMCAGLIINSRISLLVYGAREKLTGSCGSVIDLFMENYPSRPKVRGGILADESAALLKRFFEKLR